MEHIQKVNYCLIVRTIAHICMTHIAYLSKYLSVISTNYLLIIISHDVSPLQLKENYCMYRGFIHLIHNRSVEKISKRYSIENTSCRMKSTCFCKSKQKWINRIYVLLVINLFLRLEISLLSNHHDFWVLLSLCQL